MTVGIRKRVSPRSHEGAERGARRRRRRPDSATIDRAEPHPFGALQRTLGNHSVARLIQAGRDRSLASLRPAPGAGGQVIFRDAVKTPSEPQPSIEGPWGLPLTTAVQLAAYFRLGAANVSIKMSSIKGDKDLSTRGADYVDELKSWAAYYDPLQLTPLTKEDVKRANLLIDIGVGLHGEMDKILQAEADGRNRDALWKVVEEAKRAAAETEKLAPKVADTARAAFKAGDESLLADTADFVGNVTDIGLGIHELAKQTADFIAKSTIGVVAESVNKYTEALGKLNRGLAAINLALSLTGEKGKTELDEGLRWVGISAGAFSSIGTLVGLPAHMGLYANLYLVPLTKACIAGVQRIGEYVHIQNKSWVEFTGEPGNYNVEPGGKPMWDYMQKVMKASTAGDVPAPPTAIAEYFMDHEGAFEAGAKSTIPTTGTDFWIYDNRSVDRSEFGEWIFLRRKQIWAMLYGSMKTGKSCLTWR